MIDLYDIQFVDSDFTVENTINENITLKNSNRTLSIILSCVAIIAVGFGYYLTIKKSIEESTKQWD
jgi:hypothetical protein